MRPITLFLLGACALCLSFNSAHTQEYLPTWESLDSRPIPEWFQDAKFGIFIHWGVYSVPAWRPISAKRYASYAEWYYARVIGDMEYGGDIFHRTNYGENFEYRDFAPLFKAELFDPEYWAVLFHRAGAKYVVLTSKHHDGFCLWPTQSPFKKNWNSSAIGPKRNLLGDLTKAVRREGMRMGIYYSLIEWETSPTKRVEAGYYLDKKTVEKYQIPADKYVDEHLLPQLKELVIGYQPALIFADGGEWDFDEDYWKTKEFLAWLYNEAPNRNEVVVNDRWAKGMPGKHGDYFSSEYKDTDAVGVAHPWEESRGIGGSYGFNRAENLDDYSTSAELIRELIEIVSNGGNLLLNVGPTGDGRIPVIMQQRLIDIGDWLEVNGEAIYGTRPWRTNRLEAPGDIRTVYYTTKKPDLFVICLQWPREAIKVSGVQISEETTVKMLGFDESIKWKAIEGEIMLYPPKISPADIPCQHAFVFKIGTAL